MKYSTNVYLYIPFFEKYFTVLVLFSFPDTLRMFQCLVYVYVKP